MALIRAHLPRTVHEGRKSDAGCCFTRTALPFFLSTRHHEAVEIHPPLPADSSLAICVHVQRACSRYITLDARRGGRCSLRPSARTPRAQVFTSRGTSRSPLNMSSQSVSAAEQIIADRAFIFIDYCSLFAEAALILHEYLITFDSEVRLMWRRKITGASIIFFLNRYIMLLSQLFILPTWAPVSDLSCAALGWLDVIFNLAPYFVWNVFATLRVYALTGRDWRIPSIVALLMLGPIAANIYPIAFEFPLNTPPPTDCAFNNTVTVKTDRILVLVSRICLIAGDAVVIAVTWWKTYRLKREAEASNIKAPLVTMLLRDGSLYFGTMLLFNGLHIMLNLIAEVSFLGDVADTISSILISRFIINLREVDSQDRPSNETTFFNQSSHDVTSFTSEREGRGGLVFAENFVESMGAPLDESCASSEMSPEVEEGYTRCDVKA